MALPTVIGVYSRQAGVWERANGGTPAGFRGVYSRQGGVWEPCSPVYARASGVWEYCWLTVDGEIDLVNFSKFSFDFGSPGSARVDYWLNYDGTIDGRALPGIPTGREEIGQWRYYDNGREYQIKFEEDISPFFTDPWTVHPTLDTWLNWTSISTDYTFYKSVGGATSGAAQSGMYVRIRETVGAAAGGNDIGEFKATVEYGDAI